MSDRDPDTSEPHAPLSRVEWLQRRVEIWLGYEFLCHTCDRANLQEEGEGGGGCIGMCRLTDKERAKDYLGGSDGYVPRYRHRRRLGG